jgi:methyl-accepting chemotaxis protein
MKASIQIKLLVLCILLVLLATVSISITYYTLTKQDKHRESQQRIQIAFEIILDDIANQSQNYINKFDDVLTRDNTLYMAMRVYNKDVSQVSSKQFIVSRLANVGHITSVDRLALYGTDKQLVAMYQRPEDQQTGKVDSASGTEVVPLFEGDIPDTLFASLFSEGERLGIRITAPVSQGEDTTGVLIGDVFFTQKMVDRYISLSKTDVNFFAGNQFSLGTLLAQTYIEPETTKTLISCEDLPNRDQGIEIFPAIFDDQAYYQGRCALRNAQETVGAITVSLSQEIEKREITKILTVVLTISGMVCGVAFGLSVIVSRKTILSIHNIVSVVGATAEGDLRKTAIVATRDEIGMLATKLNRMINQLRTISGQVKEATYAVNSTADTILQEMERLIRHMEQQSASVDNTTGSIEKIKQFIDVVAQNTNDLLSAAAQILSSIQETRASIEEVTTSTGSLTTNLHLISASVDQVNQSVKQISENTEQLETVAQHTEAEVHQIDQSLREVSHNADRTQQLAKETTDAATRGQASVDASIQGMTELKEVVANTAQIIQEVNVWGEQVSAILGIVDEITEQTSLLALNASIISAQAGVHGRGFAVVADEIKELATRTKASTKEIGTLVHELQKKTEEGVNNTEEGLRKADQGMQLANAVKDALTIILERATRSSDRAADTAQVIQKTVDSSQMIGDQATRVTEMVSQIRTALQQQEQDTEQVVAAVENISGMAEQVNRANVEQRRAAEEIERSMAEVTRQFSDISEQTEVLQQHSDQIVTAMHTIESTTGQVLKHATDISAETVKDLIQQSNMLQQVVNIFRLS